MGPAVPVAVPVLVAVTVLVGVPVSVGVLVAVGVSVSAGKRQFPVSVILSNRNVPPLPLAPYA